MSTEYSRTGGAQDVGDENRQTAMGAVQHYYDESREQVTELVTQHPFSSVMLVFGVGFGLGVMLGSAFAEPPRRSWAQNQANNAERLGRQILDAISNVVPDSVARRLNV